jgi:integrase
LVTDILADYAEEHGPQITAPWRVAYAVRGLTAHFEGLTVAEVTKEGCRRYAAARGRSAGTVRRELGVLRAAINHAHGEGRLTRSVVVHLPDPPEPRSRWLTRNEAARLVAGALGFTFVLCSDLRKRREKWVIWDRVNANARLHLPLFILLGLYTGARKEAILSLRWSQVDLVAGRINYNVPGFRQTKKRRAHIPIPAKLLTHLRQASRRGVEMSFVVGMGGKRIGDVKRGFASACRRAGLKHVTPHTLRHTAATWLMQRGVNVWDAAGYLGMSPETLQKVYGHHHPDYLKSAAEAYG